MTRDEVFAQLTRIFVDVLGSERIVLRDETTAADVAGWDSLRHVDLIVAIESSFKISFTTRDAKKLSNVGELADAILRKRAQSAGTSG